MGYLFLYLFLSVSLGGGEGVASKWSRIVGLVAYSPFFFFFTSLFLISSEGIINRPGWERTEIEFQCVVLGFVSCV